MAKLVLILVRLVTAPIAIVWYVLSYIMAFILPLSVSGKGYLKQALERQGIDPRTIPEACIDDVVSLQIMTVSCFGRVKGGELRAELVRTLEDTAFLFTLWKQNPNSFNEDCPFREIFERHSIS